MILTYRAGEPQALQMYQPEASSQLADAMYEVPLLAQLLFSDSAAPLAACSRQLRRLIHNFTQQVTLTSEYDISQLVKSDWPQLSVVIWCDTCSCQLEWPDNAKSKLAGSLTFAQGDNFSTVFIVRPTDGQSQAHMQHSPLTTAMHVLARPNWQNTDFLTVTGYQFDADSVAQLSSLGWSRLSELCILVDKLDTATASCLIKGSWPVLQILQLETDCRDINAIRILTDHQWLSLCDIDLISGTQLLCFEFKVHSDGMPQLYRLCISDTQSDDVSISELAAMYHARLGVLRLHGAWQSAVPLPSDLMQPPWVRLALLDVTNNLFGTNDMALLAQAQLPCLAHLILASTGLCTSTLQLLVTGNWPHLEYLDLSDNRINDTAMSHLASGIWPKLEKVQLVRNEVTPLGIACLRKASWPALFRMCVDRKAVCFRNLDAAARVQVLGQEYRIWIGTQCLKGRADKESEWCYVRLEHVSPTAQDVFLRDGGLGVAIAAILLAVCIAVGAISAIAFSVLFVLLLPIVWLCMLGSASAAVMKIVWRQLSRQ